jgi:hypothetical protein
MVFVARSGSYGMFIAASCRDCDLCRVLSLAVGHALSSFFVANLLGGLIYVPLSVGVEYVLGRGFGAVA